MLSKIFRLSRDRVWRYTWTWWWWIFFIESPGNPDTPRQLMILWSTKDCWKIRIHDVFFGKDKKTARSEKASRFGGAVAAWFFDGEKMHDPFVLETCDLCCEKTPQGGSVCSLPGKSFEYVLSKKVHRVSIKHKDSEFFFEMRPGGEKTTEPVFGGKRYLGKLGYDRLKIDMLPMKGRIVSGKKEEKIRGTAYFQKIDVNAPAIPWYWTITHFEDGSMLYYFLPHVGLAFLRRNDSEKSVFQHGNVVFGSKKLVFFDAETGESHNFRGFGLKRRLNDKNLPVFSLKARQNGEEFSAELNSYSKAFWRFEQPLLGPLSSVFYYNEYPVRVSRLFLRKKDGSVKTLRETGRGVGNCEQSWGLLF